MVLFNSICSPEMTKFLYKPDLTTALLTADHGHAHLSVKAKIIMALLNSL